MKQITLKKLWELWPKTDPTQLSLGSFSDLQHFANGVVTSESFHVYFARLCSLPWVIFINSICVFTCSSCSVSFFFFIQVAKTLSTGVHPKKLNWKIHCSLIFTGTWNIVNCSYGNKIARLDIFEIYSKQTQDLSVWHTADAKFITISLVLFACRIVNICLL